MYTLGKVFTPLAAVSAARLQAGMLQNSNVHQDGMHSHAVGVCLQAGVC
jgi:hypothetical protein